MSKYRGERDRLFAIRSSPDHYFYAGDLRGGQQAVVARSVYGRITIAILNQAGDLIDVVRRELPSPPVFPDSGQIREVDEDMFLVYLHQEFGFVPSTVRAKEFHIEPEGFAVYQLPDHYQHFLRDPNAPSFDDEEREVLPRLIEEWVAEGQFVLEWGNDYWLNRDGEVVAT